MIKEHTITKPMGALERMAQHHLSLPQVPFDTFHHFSPGLYTREVNVPPGTVIIGRYQRNPHLNIFLEGHIFTFNEDGSTTELIAPMIFTSPPGRKAGYVHKKMVWLNVYHTDETDIEILEAMIYDEDGPFVHQAERGLKCQE